MWTVNKRIRNANSGGSETDTLQYSNTIYRLLRQTINIVVEKIVDTLIIEAGVEHLHRESK